MKRADSEQLRKLTDDLFRARSVGEYDVDPRGDIVYSSNDPGQWQLFSMRQDGGGGYVARQITSGDQSNISPRFIQSGSQIMFFSDYGGDEKYDIHLAGGAYGALSGTSRNITENSDYSILPSATASDDGSLIAYVSDESGRFASYVLDNRSGKALRLTDHKESDSDATISPDGRYVAIEYMAQGQDIHTSVYSLPQGKLLFTVGEKDYGRPVDASDCSWSTASDRLLFTSSERGYKDIACADVRTQQVKWLTCLKEECYEPISSHDGTKVAFTVARRGSVVLATVSIPAEGESGAGPVELFSGPGLVSEPKFSGDDSTVFFLFSSPSDTQDIWSFEIESGKCRRLTNHSPEGIRQMATSSGEEVECVNPVDGKRVPALLFRARVSRASAARMGVVYLHGGPASLTVNSWDPMVQLFLGAGVNVIAPNYRGSTGYGKDFRDSNRHVMGSLDVADCVAARNYLVENGLAELDRVAVTGASFGGYLTMCCLTYHPDLWKCGAAGVPFLNWFTEMESERGDLQYWDRENMGDPAKDADRLRAASPYFFLDRIKAPVLIIAGGNDPRCPLEESESAVKSLKDLGKEVEFKFYHGEGHWFRKLDNSVDADSRTFQFIIDRLGSV